MASTRIRPISSVGAVNRTDTTVGIVGGGPGPANPYVIATDVGSA